MRLAHRSNVTVALANVIAELRAVAAVADLCQKTAVATPGRSKAGYFSDWRSASTRLTLARKAGAARVLLV